MVCAELSKEGSSSQRKYTCDVHARRRMSEAPPPRATQKRLQCQHGRRKDQCPQCNGCQHGRRKGRCSQCNGCQHGHLKDACRQCNGCPHGRRKNFCKDCNHYTCQVDGCLYKGHRFCSKYSLKHHTSRICPSQTLVFVDGQWVKAGNSSQHSQESVAETPVPVRVPDPMFRFIRKATVHKTG